jgi:hypothetical protein
MKMKAIILTCFIQFNFLLVFAQNNKSTDDFHYTRDTIFLKSDTIVCSIQTEEPYNKGSITYKITEHGGKKSMRFTEILMIEHITKYFDKITYQDKTYLWQRIVKGKVSLYKLGYSNTWNPRTINASASHYEYFIIKANEIVKLTGRNYKDIIKRFIPDPDYFNRINKLYFMDLEYDLKKIIEDYNTSKN